jgi:hypothetical protein
VSGSNVVVQESTDSGASFSTVDTRPLGGNYDVPNACFSSSSAAYWTGYEYTSGTYTLITRTNSSGTWADSETQSNMVGRGGTVDSSSNIWVVADGSLDYDLHVRELSGGTWTEPFLLLPSNVSGGTFSRMLGGAMAHNPTTGALYFSGDAYDSAHWHAVVYQSTNGGGSWSQIDSYQYAASEDTFSERLAVDPSGKVFETVDASDVNGVTHALIRRVF